MNASNAQEGIDLMDQFHQNQSLEYVVPEGEYELRYGILQHGHREVMHGAPGAAGPVMNHYDKEVTLAYLGRLEKISDDTGAPLSQLVRALFCDSIELGGANWTDEMEEIFYEAYGYQITPYSGTWENQSRRIRSLSEWRTDRA